MDSLFSPISISYGSPIFIWAISIHSYIERLSHIIRTVIHLTGLWWGLNEITHVKFLAQGPRPCCCSGCYCCCNCYYCCCLTWTSQNAYRSFILEHLTFIAHGTVQCEKLRMISMRGTVRNALWINLTLILSSKHNFKHQIIAMIITVCLIGTH